MAYSVAIVVTPDIGGALTALADRVHVWLADTPANHAAAETYRRTHPTHSLERGVTTFRIADSDSPEAQVVQILGDLNLHHGEDSHTPPWDGLEIYGAAPSPTVRDALAAFGVDEIHPTPGGFRCKRSAAGAA